MDIEVCRHLAQNRVMIEMSRISEKRGHKMCVSVEQSERPLSAGVPFLHRITAPASVAEPLLTAGSRIVDEDNLSMDRIPSQQHNVRIGVKLMKMILFIDPEEVIAVLAKGNYVKLLRLSDSCLVRESISMVAEKLKSFGFIRIHRSILVNCSHVEEVRSSKAGEYTVRVNGAKEYAVTRNYRSNLRDLAVLWIGADRFVECP